MAYFFIVQKAVIMRLKNMPNELRQNYEEHTLQNESTD